MLKPKAGYSTRDMCVQSSIVLRMLYRASVVTQEKRESSDVKGQIERDSGVVGS